MTIYRTGSFDKNGDVTTDIVRNELVANLKVLHGHVFLLRTVSYHFFQSKNSVQFKFIFTFQCFVLWLVLVFQKLYAMKYSMYGKLPHTVVSRILIL